MKRITIITGVLACLMVLLMAMGSVCGALVAAATDVHFYGGMSRAAVMETLGVTDADDASAQTTAYIGLTDAEQDVFAQQIVQFMKGETDAQPDVLNEREQQHMIDVRSLVQLAGQVSKTCMTLAAGLAVVAAWTGAQGKRRGMPVGMLAGVLIAAACAGGAYLLVSTQGFESAFYRMHELLFANDLWLLNPETDILIRMMPQALFEQAATDVAIQVLRTFLIVGILVCAVYLIVGGMIRRNLTEREKQ